MCLLCSTFFCCSPGRLRLCHSQSCKEVNGQDLSKASHEEAVEAFRTAHEPIVVEVLRRGSSSSSSRPAMASSPSQISSDAPPPAASPGTKSSSCCRSPSLADAVTQTEWDGGWEFPRPSTPPPGLFSLNKGTTEVLPQKPMLDGDVITQLEMVNAFVDNPETDLHDDSFEDLRTYDIEYEEVTLQRTASNDKLGLTLCYGSGEDVETSIFVSEINPIGIAAQDGRIREGDQILQVNGVDILTRNQAMALFAEDKADVTLLVARPQLQEDELDDPYLLDPHALLQVPQEEDEDNMSEGEAGDPVCNQHEKDSGVGRTDESTRNDESSDHEGGCPSPAAPGEPSMLGSPPTTLPAPGTGGLPDSDGSIERELALLSREMASIQLECQSIVRAHASPAPAAEHIYCNLPLIPGPGSPRNTGRPRAGSGGSGNHEVGRPPCALDKAEAVEQWVKSTNAANAARAVCDDKDTCTSSSAYNTGESCRSTPLTLELAPPISAHDNGSGLLLASPKMADKSTQLAVDSDAYSVYSCQSCSKCVVRPPPVPAAPTSPYRKEKSRSRERDNRSSDVEKNRNYVTLVPNASTMYTNEANLEHTIWLQQQLFRQTLLQQQQRLHAAQLQQTQQQRPPQQTTSSSTTSSPKRLLGSPKLNHPSHNASNNNETAASSMEWKVKRRADGTRYITRRPVRNRLLRERANKIFEERGLTTDDDAQSELKVGRYWSKEDRKRHLEKARDQKRKRDMILRMRNEMKATEGTMTSYPPVQQMSSTLSPTPHVAPMHHHANNIIELSHKKMMKKKGRTLFDDFTTVQEVLAHGTRGPQGTSKAMGLLSVTTV